MNEQDSGEIKSRAWGEKATEKATYKKNKHAISRLQVWTREKWSHESLGVRIRWDFLNRDYSIIMKKDEKRMEKHEHVIYSITVL